MVDHYAVLGVAPTATNEEIRAAYRQAARRHHPDAGGTHDRMVAINAAYEILGNPARRVAYDRVRGEEQREEEMKRNATAGSATRQQQPGAQGRTGLDDEPVGTAYERAWARSEQFARETRQTQQQAEPSSPKPRWSGQPSEGLYIFAGLAWIILCGGRTLHQVRHDSGFALQVLDGTISFFIYSFIYWGVVRFLRIVWILLLARWRKMLVCFGTLALAALVVAKVRTQQPTNAGLGVC